MPLPSDLQELLGQAEPDFIILSPDQLRKLDAYLRAPDVFWRDISLLYREAENGGGPHGAAWKRHKAFHGYLRRVQEYNRSSLASPPCQRNRLTSCKSKRGRS